MFNLGAKLVQILKNRIFQIEKDLSFSSKVMINRSLRLAEILK